MNTGYVHCALLALGHIRAGENNDKGSLLMSCAAGSGHIRAGENNDKGSLLMTCAAGSGHIRAGENNDKGSLLNVVCCWLGSHKNR